MGTFNIFLTHPDDRDNFKGDLSKQGKQYLKYIPHLSIRE